MKQIAVAVVIIVVIISLIVTAFTINQVYREEQRLSEDLEYRSTLLAENLKNTIEPNFTAKSSEELQKLVNKFDSEERFVGMNIYDNKGDQIATSSSLPAEIPQAQEIAEESMDADKANGTFVKLDNEKMYLLAMPLHQEESIVGALMIAQNASYIDSRLTEIWRNNLVRLLVQASLISLAAFLLLRWIIYEPIRSLVEFLKSARTGELNENSQNLPSSLFFRPLIKEVSNIRRSLLEARVTASEEAKLRLEKVDSPWTAQRLTEFIKDVLKDRTIVVVSNREPYIHTKMGRKINYFIPASGMVTAIEPVMEACGGIWVAHGSGDADRLVVDAEDKLRVPPDEPKYTLRRVWLTDSEETGYYYGFANEGMWPLCHIAHVRPTFRKEDWEEYKRVNGKFAQAVLSEIKLLERPIILVQDFHLSLLPRMVKKARPDATVALFWHIPWPNPESFSVCPWKKEILDGMLGSDLIGFHTQLHCNNFIETVSRELESLIDFEQFTITRNGHTSYIKPFPISIAFPNHGNGEPDSFHPDKLIKDLHINTKYIGLGVDRLDYTKGILERLKGVEIFLQRNPQYHNNFTFIQIAAPSRSRIERYQQFVKEVENEVERINKLFKKGGWKPILLIEKHHSQEEVYRFYKLVNVCLVTSLHDGMNLVAKEFIASRDDEKGVLILSQFTGASRELKDALIVNPYNGEQTAEALKVALEMSPTEQTKRMRRLRETIKNYNIYRWSAELLKNIVNLER
ncbi:trehalose-6-phosphate synthase [Candidatus Daviesbacteria bacterium]|nr:trehalose-6-phosphate synthase [Candidatus Daviesbacteria bacterium]